MITKGVSHIGGVHSLQSRPGQKTESSELLKLHQLAAEKESLMKKLAWIKGQKDQAEKRLSEIVLAMRTIEKDVEKRASKEPISGVQADLHTTFIKY